MLKTEKIKGMLKEAGLKGIDVAEKLGIDSSSLSQKLGGTRPFRTEELEKIQVVLAEAGRLVSMDEFFE